MGEIIILIDGFYSFNPQAPISQYLSLFSSISDLSRLYHSFPPLPNGSVWADGKAGREMRAIQ